MAANRHYLKTHPDAVDAVELAAGGSPKKRMDVGPIADEVRTLWWDKFWPKLRLARKFSCATTTIDRALKLAYAKTGEKVPAEAERRRHIIACLRKQLDEGAQLLDIAREAGISDVTARAWLRKSFEAERKAMPDLRRRGK